METLLDHDKVQPEELEKFRRAYYEELRLNQAVGAGARTRFEYAWCLMRSDSRADIKRGVTLLEDLFATGDEESRWDYLFYLAVAYTKLGDYKRAQDGCHELLAVEPNRSQAQELLQQVQHRMTKEGLKRLAMSGGAFLIVSGLLGLGMALTKTYPRNLSDHLFNHIYSLYQS